MRVSKFLGALLPTHPDFLPIIQELREKYQLAEISPDDDPIEEVCLGNEIIPLKEFRRDIENLVRENLGFMPPDTKKLYVSAKILSAMTEFKELEILTAETKIAMEAFIKFIKGMMQPIVQLLDVQIDSVVNMLYIYLLTGETEEAPSDWFGKVVTLPISGEPIIMAMANQVTNLDVLFEQIRKEHKNNFGANRPKITDTVVSTGYYMQLQRAKKPWSYIVEEFIKKEKVSLPRDRNSERYKYIRHKCEQALRKRLQRSEKILDIILVDKK